MASETRFNHPASHLSSSGPRCRFPASCAQCLQLAPATYLASHPSAYAPIWPTRQPFIHPPIHASIHSSTTPLVDPATHPAAILYATFRALTHPSTHPCLHPSVIHPFIRSSTLIPVHPCIHPDIHPSINQCIHPSSHPKAWPQFTIGLGGMREAITIKNNDRRREPHPGVRYVTSG